MLVEVYHSISENSITVVPHDAQTKMLADDAILLRTITGKNWEECMSKHHVIMGYEPYKPIKD